MTVLSNKQYSVLCMLLYPEWFMCHTRVIHYRNQALFFESNKLEIKIILKESKTLKTSDVKFQRERVLRTHIRVTRLLTVSRKAFFGSLRYRIRFYFCVAVQR